MTNAAESILAAILAGLSVLHFYWAIGGRWGLAAAVPQNRDGSAVFQPGRAACLGVAALLLLSAAGVLATLDPWLKTQWLRALAVVLGVRAVGDFRYVGFSKRLRGTVFAEWDTKLHSPLCTLLSLLALVASTRTA